MGTTTGVAPGILLASYSSDFSVYNTMINLDSTGFVHLGAATGVGLDQLGNSVFTTIKPVSTRRSTFTCTAGGTITVSNTNYASGSDVVITLKTVGGTISTAPAMKTVTPGTGFTVLCGAADTSTYQYSILN